MGDKKDNIEEYFKNSLGDFKIDPPEESKKKLFFWLAASNFVVLYRNYIITSCVAVAVAVSAYFIVNTKDAETQGHIKKENKVTEEKVEEENSTAIYTTTTTASTAIESKETFASPTEVQKIETENSLAATIITAAPESEIKKGAVKYEPVKTENTTPATVEEKPSYTVESTVGATIPEIIKEQIENPKEENASDTSHANVGNIVVSNLNNDFASVNQNNSPDDTLAKITDLIDSVTAVAVRDTTDNTASVAVKDTLPMIAAAKKFGFYTGLSTSYMYWLNKDSVVNLGSSFSIGSVNELRYKNAGFGLGVLYSQQNMNLYNYQMDSSISYQYKNNYKYELDSTMNWDSTYTYFTDSTLIDTDTVEVKKYSTTKTTQNMTVSYVTLPLFLTWNKSFGKHEVGVSAGTAMSFLVNSNGKSNSYGTDIPRSFILSGDMRLRYGYHFTERWLLSTEASMRTNFTGLTTAYKQGNTGFGLNLGLLYKF